MAKLSLEITLTINEQSNAASVNRVTDALGLDRTPDFNNYANNHSLPLSTQAEIEDAASKFVMNVQLP